jgi:hypothetical protein
LGAIVAFAVAEIFCASFYYISRTRESRATATTTIPSTVLIPAPSAPPLRLASPAPLTAASPVSVLAEPDRLLKDAVALRDKGDTTNALAKLQEAAQREPKNASVLAEMATTYESMGLVDRSNETWRKIHELGPSAGDFFAKADKRLKIGVAAAAGATPSAPPTASLDAGTATVDGIPAGATLGIAEVKATETPDPDADTNLMLRLAVKKRPNAVIDHTKVKIQVFFYDTVGDKDIKLTDADVSYEWVTPNHDWANTNSETLAVTYIRSKNKTLSSEAALAAAAAAVNPGKKGKPIKTSPPTETGDRRYCGYIVRLYYNDQLQDKRANPATLLSLFPAASTISSP